METLEGLPTQRERAPVAEDRRSLYDREPIAKAFSPKLGNGKMEFSLGPAD